MDKVNELCNKNILIVGYGSAGSYLLDMILKDPQFRDCNIGILSRNEEKCMPRIALSIVAAGIANNYQNIKFLKCDLFNHEQIVETFEKFNPDIIVNTSRFMSGHKYGAYSYPNEIGYGVWSPMSVSLIYRLMKAVNEYEITSGKFVDVINTSYPDATNPWLDSIGLAPTTGAGNVNHLIPRIKRAVVKIYNEKYGDFSITPYDVDVDLFCSHHANTYISKEGLEKSPTLIQIKINGINFEVNKSDLYSYCKDNTASGQVRNVMIATDCYMICKALTSYKGEMKIHLPGVKGYIGGYSCTISTDSNFKSNININCCDNNEFALGNVVRVNAESMTYDGVESIVRGNLVFTDEVIYKMKSVFNIDYPKKISIVDAEEFAKVISDGLSRYDERNSK